MLEKAADTLIAAVELLEAEGRHLRRTGADFAVWGLAAIGSAALAVLGVMSLLVGVGWQLANVVGVAGSLAIMGAVAALLGIGLAALSRQRMRAAGGSAP